MGSHQERWFYNELTKSSQRGAKWRIIGQQIIFSRIRESFGWNGDNWNVSDPWTMDLLKLFRV
jgi:alkaline phosphatase D